MNKILALSFALIFSFCLFGSIIPNLQPQTNTAFAQNDDGRRPTDFEHGGAQQRLKLLGYDFGVPNYEVSFIDIVGFLLYLASNLIGIAGFIAIIYIIIGGITLTLSGGNEEKAQQGKKTLTYAIAGFILAVVAFLIVNTFLRYIIGVEITDLPTTN